MTSESTHIPFPWTPYPQQREAMQTIYNALIRRDEQLQQQRPARSENAHVVLLESPTGTGKSLSLACATIAWLKYRETADLEVKDQSMTSCSNKDGSTHVIGEDWVDAWARNRSAKAEEEVEKRRNECVMRAKLARSELEQELEGIRSRLETLVNNVKEGGAMKVDDSNHMQVLRQNLARSAVTAAKLAERRSSKSKRIRRISVNQDKLKSSPGSSTPSEVGEDFCVQDYRSDDDIFSSDSEDDDCTNSEPLPPPGGRSSIMGTVAPQSIVRSASEIIDGGRLDGSNANKLYDIESGGLLKMKRDQCKKGETVGDVDPGFGVRKIIYAARTHSQLSQFVGEIRRTHWGKNIRAVALGGRKLLCGNREVSGTNNRSEAAINERCLDLIKGAIKSTSKKRTSAISSTTGCPLKASKEAISALSVQIMAQPSDIEDIRNLGAASHTCSYYASRLSIPGAEVVLLPYSLLLSQTSQASIGLSLRNSVVVIDEAHNIPEALCSISAVKLTLPVVQAASSQVTSYLSRYSVRLAGRNLFYISQIRRCLNAIMGYLSKSSSSNLQKKSKMLSTTELIFTLKLDNINFIKIDRYLTKSRLPNKLLGFMQNTSLNVNGDKSESLDENDPRFLSKHVSPLSIVQKFFQCLARSKEEGKISVDWASDSSSDVINVPTLRYVLLNPSAKFAHVLRDAHTIILAGGTMRPFGHIACEILGPGSAQREAVRSDTQISEATFKDSSVFKSSTDYITCFSCSHVVPPSNINLICLPSGPTSTKLDFRHSSRLQNDICDELGRVLFNICCIVPAGVVVFLPSYSYVSYIVKRWKLTGAWTQIKKRKRVYFEPPNSREVEDTLESFSNDATRSSGGAVLLSVVGGKMSEGINFSDEMARCVLVAGLPYPDITSPELQEKMRLMDESLKKNGSGISGNQYYHNLCMRAINQSIGRAIRHINDYAAIVLADVRYCTDERVWKCLPEWLKNNSKRTQQGTFGQTLINPLRSFFKDMSTKRLQ